MKKYTGSLAIISILADGQFYSEKYLKKHLNIDSISIKKHIQTLRSWGVNILTVLGEGYILLQPIQLLDALFIYNQIKITNIKILPIIDSTNQYLIDHTSELHHGDVCIAEYQEMGRGRHGRQWFSSFGANICLSMYWSFKHKITTIVGLNIAIAISIANMLQKLCINKIQVKLPNDLYLNNRKLAGILVESISKIGGDIHLAIGIGINLAMHNTHRLNIHQPWINLEEITGTINRNILVVLLIKELHSALMIFEQKGLAPFISKWEILDNFINYPVKLL